MRLDSCGGETCKLNLSALFSVNVECLIDLLSNTKDVPCFPLAARIQSKCWYLVFEGWECSLSRYRFVSHR